MHRKKKAKCIKNLKYVYKTKFRMINSFIYFPPDAYATSLYAIQLARYTCIGKLCK